MKKQISTFLTLAILVSFISFSACKKKENPSPPAATAPSEILVSPFPALLTGSYSSGELLKLNYSGGIIKQVNLNVSVFNFRRWTINDKIYYTYCQYDYSTMPTLTGWIAGSIMITDSALNIIDSVHLVGHAGHDSRLDGHDFLLLGPNHYIAETYYQEQVNNIPDSVPHIANCNIMAPLIQEVNNGNVVFEWNASNYPEFYAASVQGNDFTSTDLQDYMHMNAITIDPVDNNLIISFRQTDQIIKINRTSGAIMWRLGGASSDFPITADEQFLRQHDVSLTSYHSLMMVDNGLAGVRAYTRISEFVLDEANKTITSFKTTLLPDSAFISYMGSAQKIGDTYFIGGGTLPMNFTLDATTGALISEQALTSNSYRAFKY
jgi:arylsulfate sulfotransferase